MVGVVDPVKAAKFANLETPSEETLRDPVFIETVLKDLYEIGNKAKLNSLEKPKQIYLTYEMFDIETNCILTTTSKMKRNVARVYFKEQVK
jgi:hypothetical protein